MKTQTSAGFRDPASGRGVETVEVPEDRDGQRIDNFLCGAPQGRARKATSTGCSGPARSASTASGPSRTFGSPPATRCGFRRSGLPSGPSPAAPPAGQAARVEASILSEDREFLVIDKPAGVASHGGSGVSFGAIELLRAARPRDTLELAHRLDRDTSGVLVLAKKRSALTRLQAEIREGRVEKRYLALLAGTLPQQKLIVDVPLRKSVLQGGERMVRVDDDGKPSRSRFSEVERFDEATLAEIAIETGRTHQIRVHSAHIGHPVAGDEKYGEREFNRAMRERGLKRLFLHAARFEFSIGERSYGFSAPLPDELKRVLDALALPDRRPREDGDPVPSREARKKPSRSSRFPRE